MIKIQPLVDDGTYAKQAEREAMLKRVGDIARGVDNKKKTSTKNAYHQGRNSMELIKDLGMQYATENSKQRNRYGLYECSCGQEFKAMTTKVKNGHISGCRECGNKRMGETHITHGMTDTPLHKKWKNMKTRCYNPKDISYHNYGGKGITVCDEWKDNFQAFYDFAMSNGYEEGLSIDRINPDGNYESTNVQFIGLSENSIRSSTRDNFHRNKNIKISIDQASGLCEAYCTGLFTVKEMAEGYEVGRGTIRRILKEAGITSIPSIPSTAFKSKLERMRA